MVAHARILKPAKTISLNRAERLPRFAGASTRAVRCRKKFLRFFPDGFDDLTYLEWERNYKWEAHRRWNGLLDRATMRELIRRGDFREVADRAVRIEARTNLLFSFEKMALRDAVRTGRGAKLFAYGLFGFLHGPEEPRYRFEHWCDVLALLPRRQTRVLTWPLATVFGFIAQPKRHLFFKPNVTRIAARAYGFDFHYRSQPNWDTYRSLLAFGAAVRKQVMDLHPRDNIDIQSFIWVQGSDEYEE